MIVYVLSSTNEAGEYTIDGVYSTYELAENGAFKMTIYEAREFEEGDIQVEKLCKIRNGKFLCFYKDYLNSSWVSNDIFGLTFRIEKFEIDKNKPYWE